MSKKFGFSWSWKRAIGVSGLKNKISRRIGIPLTKSGRERKVGRMIGCCVSLFAIITLFLLFTSVTLYLIKIYY